MALIFHSSLSKDFALILNDSDDFNVIIKVGESQNAKEFRAHSVILRARSSYFKSALSADWTIKKDNMIMFNKQNITPTVFDIILKYIYTGELDLTKQLGEDIIGLLVASDELLIEELFKHVQDYLIEKQSTWVQQNFASVLHLTFKLESCKKLQDYCLEYICKDPHPFITSETFLSLDKDILFCLFKRDDFRIKEIVAWDFLIKWGIMQISELRNGNSNMDRWTDKNYEDLKDKLSDFIPLIKFLKITSEDFHHKVRPFKAIIPNDIYEEAMTHYLVDQPKLYSHIQIESNIINPINIANIIANWIDRNDSTIHSPNNKYKFNLIYSMSRDGFDKVTFYNKCNGQGPFVVLIRVQSKKIYGGYHPIGYANRNDGWKYSTESFVFSFENDQDIFNMKIGRVTNANYAVCEIINYGHFFNFGCCLYIDAQNLCVGHNNTNYSNIFNKDELSIEEIEALSVEKL